MFNQHLSSSPSSPPVWVCHWAASSSSLSHRPCTQQTRLTPCCTAILTAEDSCILRYSQIAQDHRPTPRLPIQRLQPSCAGAHAHVHPSPRTLCMTFSPGEWCTLAPPPHLTPGLQTSGAFAEDQDEVGGVMMVEGSALVPIGRHRWNSVDIRGQRLQMQTHPTPVCLQRQSAAPSHPTGCPRGSPSRMSWLHDDIDTFPPLSLYYTCKVCLVAQEFSQTGGVDTHVSDVKVAHIAANPRHAHWEAVKQKVSTTSLTHPTHVLHMRRSAAHRGAIQM